MQHCSFIASLFRHVYSTGTTTKNGDQEPDELTDEATITAITDDAATTTTVTTMATDDDALTDEVTTTTSTDDSATTTTVTTMATDNDALTDEATGETPATAFSTAATTPATADNNTATTAADTPGGGGPTPGVVIGIVVAVGVLAAAGTAAGVGSASAAAGAAQASTTAVAGAAEIVPAVLAASATGAIVIGAVTLLEKYGLKRRVLEKTNILSPETPTQRMVSKDVIQVKDAPDMNLMEAVRHFTFLLSEKNLQSVNHGTKSRDHDKLLREVEAFSEEIQEALATYNPETLTVTTSSEDSGQDLSSSPLTATAASRMFEQSRTRAKGGKSAYDSPIDDIDRHIVIERATCCLGWAHDPVRLPVQGAENMTNDQVQRGLTHWQRISYKCVGLGFRF